MIYAIEAKGSRGECPHGAVKPGSIKFGKARDPEARVRTFATSSPFPLELLASVDWPDEVERLIHAAFKQRRIHGEWFEPDRHVASFVSTMMCPNGATDEEKYTACMTILVEMLSGWELRPGLDYGSCRAPDKTQPPIG